MLHPWLDHSGSPASGSAVARSSKCGPRAARPLPPHARPARSRAPEAVVVSDEARALRGRQQPVVQIQAQERPGTEAETLADEADEISDHSASVQVNQKPEDGAVWGERRRVVKLKP